MVANFANNAGKILALRGDLTNKWVNLTHFILGFHSKCTLQVGVPKFSEMCLLVSLWPLHFVVPFIPLDSSSPSCSEP